MHPLTRFFNYLKRIDFSMALAREHIGHRDLTGWYPEWMYELMETDEIRNQAYSETIRDTVAGKTVLELGTGRRALWAIHSARAGARKVYAIEANTRAYESSLQFLKSQQIDNVHLVHGFSDKVTLPERCDVLVHDLIGDIGSSEGMIPFIEDAKQRLLTPDALHIPRRCSTYGVLVEDPKMSWKEWAFSYAMREFAPFERLSFVRFFGFPGEAALSEPQLFEDFVYRDTPDLHPRKRLLIDIQRNGQLRGVLFFIRLHFGETRVVDTWKSETTWATPYVRFQAPTAVKAGDRVEVTFDCDLSDNPSYSMKLQRTGGTAASPIGEYVWAGD